MLMGVTRFVPAMHKLANGCRDRLVAALTLFKLLKLAQAFEHAAVVVKLQVYLGLCDVYAVIIIAARDCRNQHFVCIAVLAYGNGVLSGGDYVLYFRFCRYLNAIDVNVGLHLLGRNYVFCAAVLAKNVGTVGLNVQHRSAALTI